MKFQNSLKGKKTKWIIAFGIIIIAAAGIFLVSRGNSGYEEFTVVRRDLADEVKIAGRVEAEIVTDMGFDVSGRVRSAHVHVGDQVSLGQVLVSLDSGTLLAELRSAEAELKLKKAEAANTQVSLEEVTKQQDTLVENAYRTLLSSDLIARPDGGETDQTPPVILGTYSGKEGEYKIQVEASVTGGTYRIRVFGIETPNPVDIKASKAVPLGTHGLTISFPDDLSEYLNSIWMVRIPNVEGDSYTSNYNVYQNALRTRDREIREAEAELRELGLGNSVVGAGLERAQADVDRIRAELSKYTLRAPFKGTATRVDADPGEIMSANTIAVSIISSGLGIEVDLPEIDSVKVMRDDPATITVDAFGEEEKFSGHVVSVNRTESFIDDIPVYEARLGFETVDSRIVSGMTAEVTILTDSREDVLTVPFRAIEFRSDGTSFVRLKNEKDFEERDVAIGLRGADSFIEITSGLEEGDIVLIPL